jgi:two-component system CheB/CheR fusion protein
MMAELLSKYTDMRVSPAQNGSVVERDCVYLIPPTSNLTLFHGQLYLTERDRHSSVPNLPVDIFFRSLAADAGARAIGVVLSGTGSDGTLGIRAIKEANGLVVVQAPGSAQFDGMPNSAIHTGLADFVLSPEEIPAQILRYAERPLPSVSEGEGGTVGDLDSLNRLLALLREQSGLDFSCYRPTTILRRLERRMGITQTDPLARYVDLVERDAGERQLLRQDLLIGVTRFFRDENAFSVLSRHVFPRLLAEHKQGDRNPLRFWVAGCSTGEEVYSLVILWREFLAERDRDDVDLKVFATDVDERALETASAGRYPASIVADVPLPLLGRYFLKREDTYQVVERVRKSVVFAQHDLLRDAPFNRIDLVSCRNLLIYLKPEVQQRILGTFGFSLMRGGYLFLGASETVGELQSLFSLVDGKWKIFRYKGGARYAEYHRHDPPRYAARGFLAGRRAEHQGPYESDAVERVLREGRDQLLSVYVPATLVVTPQLEVVGTYGDAGRYLRLPRGRLSNSLTGMAYRDLGIAISSAVNQALRKSRAVTFRNVAAEAGDAPERVTILAQPFVDQQSESEYCVVALQPEPSPTEDNGAFADRTRDYDRERGEHERVRDLEHELQHTRENLQATIEELETSNEELQATNEELMSANEELQSTNEELQSVNEELQTLNAEYQNKIQELTLLNNDMDNLLVSTDIGTLFLDRTLRIRKFTPVITRQFPVIEQDIGRPIQHLVAHFHHPELLSDLGLVLDRGEVVERDVEMESGSCYQMRILPYRTQNGTVDGIVLTFVDVTRRKALEEQARRLATVVQDSNDAVIVQEFDGTIVAWNRRAVEMYGYSEDDAVGMSINAIIPPEKTEEVVRFTERVRNGEIVPSFETERLTRDGRRLRVWLTASTLMDETGKPARLTTTDHQIDGVGGAGSHAEQE